MLSGPLWEMSRPQHEWVTALREKLANDKYNADLRRELNLTLGPLTIAAEQRAAYARMLEETRAANARYWWRYHNQFIDNLHGRNGKKA